MKKSRDITVILGALFGVYLIHKTSLICKHGCFSHERANVFGRPSLETALEYCKNDENPNPSERFLATLYRGNGGATVAFFYSVAVKFSNERETQVYWTYSEPEIKKLNCSKDSVSFHANKDEEFKINQIRELMNKPIGYYRSKLDMR